ncbi:MAG: hypothetical protein R3C14_34545 [Caldilineaceae bacterium]
MTTLAHLQTCQLCQARMSSLLQGLMSDQEDTLTCAEAQRLFPEYVEAALLSIGTDIRWQPLQLHLLTCPQCAELMLELHQWTVEAYQLDSHWQTMPVLEAVTATAAHAISTPLAEVRWRIDELGALFIEFSRSLLNTFPAPVAIGLKGESSRKVLCRVDLQEVFPDLTVSILAQEAPQDPAHCELLIDVDVPSRGGWPNLAGIEVVVRRGDQLLASHLTDAYGKTVVAGIRTADLAQLTLQVQPNVA